MIDPFDPKPLWIIPSRLNLVQGEHLKSQQPNWELEDISSTRTRGTCCALLTNSLATVPYKLQVHQMN